MYWFLIKKSFFDTVDNLISFVLVNLLSAVPVIAMYFVVKYTSETFKSNVIAAVFILFILFGCLSFGLSGMANGWANYRKSWFDSFIETFRRHFLHCVLFVFLILFIVLSLVLCIPFYVNSKSYFGVFMALILFWFVIIAAFILMFFCPIMHLYPEAKPIVVIKKSLVFVLKNKALSAYVLVISCIELVISVFTCSVIPGVAGLQLLHADTVRLVGIKENYIAKNGITSEKINYKKILADENANIGKRSLKNFFSPWRAK